LLAAQDCVAQGGTLVASGAAAAVARDAFGSFTPPALALGTYYWRTRATDAQAQTGPWAETWRITIAAPGTSIDLTGCTGPAISFGLLDPGTDSLTGNDCVIGYSAVGAPASLQVSQTDGSGRAVAGPSTILDYGEPGGSWAGSSSFGICLRSSSLATNVWTAAGTCAAANGPTWHAVPPAGEEAATAADGASATTSFRFGARTSTTQAPGLYTAQVTFTVVGVV
jgi:hypothetical protein